MKFYNGRIVIRFTGIGYYRIEWRWEIWLNGLESLGT